MRPFGKAANIDWDHPEARDTWGRLYADHSSLMNYARCKGYPPDVIHNLRTESLKGIVANMAVIHPIHQRGFRSKPKETLWQAQAPKPLGYASERRQDGSRS